MNGGSCCSRFFPPWLLNYNQVELRFKDLRVSVNISKMKAFFTGCKSGKKDILKGISGIVASGQILAIIGSSGAGKTSLLDTLVGKVRRRISRKLPTAYYCTDVIDTIPCVDGGIVDYGDTSNDK